MKSPKYLERRRQKRLGKRIKYDFRNHVEAIFPF